MKLTEITSIEKYCAIGACPAVYETDRDTYIFVGSKLTKKQISKFLQGKVGPDEAAVELPKHLLNLKT